MLTLIAMQQNTRIERDLHIIFNERIVAKTGIIACILDHQNFRAFENSPAERTFSRNFGYLVNRPHS